MPLRGWFIGSGHSVSGTEIGVAVIGFAVNGFATAAAPTSLGESLAVVRRLLRWWSAEALMPWVVRWAAERWLSALAGVGGPGRLLGAERGLAANRWMTCRAGRELLVP